MAEITRRDFVNGVAVGIGAVAAGRLPAAALAAPPGAAAYPPLRTGLRGSHPGAFEQAHLLRDGGHPGAGPIHDAGETYDLVVVGGGISGLAAAHAFREAMPAARILILENHDDVGGHAKRNEFRPAGSPTLLCNGGTLGIDSPYPYSAQADGLLKSIGLDVAAMKPMEHEDYYASRGLGHGIFFDKATFGADRLVVRHGEQPWGEVLAAAPLSARGKADIAMIEEGGADWLPGLDSAAKKDRLSRISYRAWLGDHARAGPEALAYFQPRSQGWWGVGIDAITALDAWGMGFPGFGGLKLEKGGIPRMGYTPRGYADTGGSYTLHFPDGNATIVRLLTRSLVPDFLPGRTAADSVLADADYAALDRAGRPVRIRLSSIVLSVKHRGDPARASGVDLVYVTGTTLKAVHAARVVMASWNMMIPYIVPDLPEAQAAAMHELVKAPLVYTSVALRSAEAFDRLKVARVSAPGCFFTDYGLNEVVDVGGYDTPRDPAKPTIVKMEHVPCEPGLPEKDQNRAGRAKLLATPFADYEAHIRDELGRALAGGGFDPARDITAITVNRWPHGYAPEYNPLWEEPLPEDRTPQAIARRRFGRIAIANSDCGGGAYTNVAIDQAYRAVGGAAELIKEEDGEATLRAGVYAELRHRMITGRLAPGVGISTRGLAQQLGVSQMPVRDALSRLAAEGAVEIRSKRRIVVPTMTPALLDEVMRCRLLLEPEAAAQALPALDAKAQRALRAADAAIDAALAEGDVNAYMENNHAFHFLIYRAGGQGVLTRTIETLWTRFGPLMRVVYGRVGTARLVDQHQEALDAIARGDEPALRAAIAADIADGQALIALGED